MRRNLLSRGLTAIASSSSSASSSSCASPIASSSRAFHVASSAHAESSTSASTFSSSPPADSAQSGGRGRRPPAGRGRGPARAQLPPYADWKHGDGKHLYEKPPPGIGPHWIADTALRDEMWSLHASDPSKWGPRELSAKYGIAINRIEAVLRLKALEGEWTLQGKPLQSAFAKSMEKLLGSTRLIPASSSTSTSKVVREDSLADEATAAAASASSSTSGSGDIRGPVREEVGESDVSEPTDKNLSVIAQALKVRQAERAKRLTVLPTGGPAVPKTKTEADKVEHGSKELKAKTRPTLRITEVPNKSYAGAGVVARNQHRAERRKRAAKTAAAAAAERKSHGEGRRDAVKQGKVIAV